jgi:hypothetical protein
MPYRSTRSSLRTQYTWLRVFLGLELRHLNKLLLPLKRCPPCKPARIHTTHSLSLTATWDTVRWQALNPFADMGLNANDPNMVRCVYASLPRILHLILIFLLCSTAPNDDELAAVPSADVRCHVQPSHSRSNHCTEPPTGSYGPPSQTGLPERKIPGVDVRNLIFTSMSTVIRT